MLGATATTRFPDVAPAEIVSTMDVALHELIGTVAPFNVRTLPFCKVPNPVPVIVTWLPIDPVVAETAVIAGAGVAPEETEILSRVAVANVEL
jgi:hypothetical protein